MLGILWRHGGRKLHCGCQSQVMSMKYCRLRSNKVSAEGLLEWWRIAVAELRG